MAPDLKLDRRAALDDLRRQLTDRRRALDPLQRAGWSVAIQRRVIDLPAFAAAGTVALYASFGAEPDTRALWEVARQAGKRVVLPAVGAGDQPELRLAGRPEALVLGQLGFQEPARGDGIPASEVDLFVTPGLGFDRRGHRLGRGKGFYDRLLAGRRAGSTTIGLTFEELLVPELEPQPRDVAVDLVVTEKAAYEASQAARPIPSR
jgi:5-formyltetrahydrofolate cyclo-ligase